MALITYRDIQDRVMDLISKSDATTRNRVKNWINMGQDDFVTRELWPFREVNEQLNTVQGTQEYDLSTEFTDIDEGNIQAVTIQGASQSKLTYIPYVQLVASYPDLSAYGAGVPRNYYLRAGKLGFWPTPNAVYDVNVDYYLNATDLEDDSDVSILPKQYRKGLVSFALSYEHDFNTDPDLAVKAMNAYEREVTLARNNLLNQPSDTGAFIIPGPADSNHKWTGLRDEVT